MGYKGACMALARVAKAVQMEAVGSQAGMRMPTWMPQMPIEDGARSGADAKPALPNLPNGDLKVKAAA